MKCWNELVDVGKKKIDANISKAAWCGHKWGVMMWGRGRGGGEKGDSWKGRWSHALKWSGWPSYWFHWPKASLATGMYPFLPKNHSQCLLLQRWDDHSQAWKPCGLQTFFFFFLATGSFLQPKPQVSDQFSKHRAVPVQPRSGDGTVWSPLICSPGVYPPRELKPRAVTCLAQWPRSNQWQG